MWCRALGGDLIGQRVFLDLALDRAAGKTQALGCQGPVPLRAAEGLFQHILLYVSQRHVFGHLKLLAASGSRTPGTAAGQVQHVGRQGVAAGEQHRRFDDIAQLPDIAGPVIGQQPVIASRFEPDDGALMLSLGLGKEPFGQGADIFAPTTQRWQRDGDNIDPVEQVLAELLLRGQFRQILVGG